MKRIAAAQHRFNLRLVIAIAFAAGSATFALTASSAGAVTIGQVSTTPGTPCTSAIDRVQISTTAGPSYAVPSTGGVTDWTLTSWSHHAQAGDGQQLAMKMFRKVADPSTYQVVAHDGPRPLTPSTLNIFPGSFRVKPGDILGSNALSPTPNGCRFNTGDPLDTYLFRDGDIGLGDSEPFTQDSTSVRLNISAEISPTNSFTLGSVARNKKKGTATITATVPNPGELTASGKGVKASGARLSKAVAAGQVKVKIRAKGKKKKTLNETGKVKLKPKIVYTPNGGSASTQSRKLKLRKKL